MFVGVHNTQNFENTCLGPRRGEMTLKSVEIDAVVGTVFCKLLVAPVSLIFMVTIRVDDLLHHRCFLSVGGV